MAITKIIKVKVNTKACIEYITNAQKTENELLTTYNGCSKENASLYFQLALDSKNKHRDSDKEIKAYHVIQSFAPTDNITPQKAHELGMKFMEETFGNKYAFVCATHVDKGHIHNHFCLCAAEKGMTGRKLNDDLSLLHKIQKNSDKLCKEYGLSVIEKKRGKSKSYAEWLADKDAPCGSKKTQLRKLIDKTVMEASSFDDFIDKLKQAGVEIETGNSKNYGTVTKYKLPDDKRFTRGYSLGSFYTDANIQKRIERHLDYVRNEEKRQALKQQKAAEKAAARKAAKQAAYDALSPSEKKLDKSKLKISSMKDTKDLENSKETRGLTKWANRQNAMRMQQIEAELKEKFGISYTDLKGQISSFRAEKNRLTGEFSKKQKDVESLREFIDSCVIYKRYKIYDINMNKSENPEEYYQKNADKIDAYEDAFFQLQQRGIDVSSITMDAIKTLQNRLLEEEKELKNLENQQLQNEKDLLKLQQYQKEVNIYLGRNDDEI